MNGVININTVTTLPADPLRAIITRMTSRRMNGVVTLGIRFDVAFGIVAPALTRNGSLSPTGYGATVTEPSGTLAICSADALEEDRALNGLAAESDAVTCRGGTSRTGRTSRKRMRGCIWYVRSLVLRWLSEMKDWSKWETVAWTKEGREWVDPLGSHSAVAGTVWAAGRREPWHGCSGGGGGLGA